MKVILLPSARGDLARIGDTIAVDSPRRAISFVEELTRRCQSLEDFPERFPLVPRFEASGVRRTVHGQYLIFYAVRGDRVFILHIVHGRMDYDNLLFPEI